MYLFVDTSTRHGAVAVWQEGKLTRVLAWETGSNHTSELMAAIEAVLSTAGGPGLLSGIGVTNGPGGFSALRAGLGTAKGFAFALGVPIVGVSTLEATAYPYRDAGFPVCAVIPAGRELVGWARFQQTAQRWQRRTPDRVTPVADLLESTRRHTLFCGEGAFLYQDRLQEAMGRRAHVVAEAMPLARVHGLAAVGAERLHAGDADTLAGLQPHYLRPPGITQPNAPRRVRQGATR